MLALTMLAGRHYVRFTIRFTVSRALQIITLSPKRHHGDNDSSNLPLSSVDLPMSRVKFNVNSEYAYLQNFKILQSKSFADLATSSLLLPKLSISCRFTI
jgi:hypothetical protein